MASKTLSKKKGGGSFVGNTASMSSSVGKLVGMPALVKAMATPAVQPAASAAAPGPTTKTVQTQGAPLDPRDSTYYDQLANNLHTRDVGLANLDQSDTYNKQDAQTSLQRLTAQYAQARDSTSTAANKQGLFYSGILGKRLGEVDVNEQNADADVNTKLARSLAESESQRRELRSQYGDSSKLNPDGTPDTGLQGASALIAATGRHINDPLATTETQVTIPPAATPSAASQGAAPTAALPRVTAPGRPGSHAVSAPVRRPTGVRRPMTTMSKQATPGKYLK